MSKSKIGQQAPYKSQDDKTYITCMYKLRFVTLNNNTFKKHIRIIDSHFANRFWDLSPEVINNCIEFIKGINLNIMKYMLENIAVLHLYQQILMYQHENNNYTGVNNRNNYWLQ